MIAMIAWLIILGFLAPLMTMSQEREVLEPRRFISRVRFYELPPGTVAYLPQVLHSSQTNDAGQWHVLVEGGRYVIPRSDVYCFVINHRDPSKAKIKSYVGVGGLSILRARSNPSRPIHLYRNSGWLRLGGMSSSNNEPWETGLKVTSQIFADAHAQDKLEENERILGITSRNVNDWWHGYYTDEDGRIRESWTERDFWENMASIEHSQIFGLGWSGDQRDLRIDAKLLRFTFTPNDESFKPVDFCIDGGSRIATILTVFGPHFGFSERRFYLEFK